MFPVRSACSVYDRLSIHVIGKHQGILLGTNSYNAVKTLFLWYNEFCEYDKLSIITEFFCAAVKKIPRDKERYLW